MQYLWTPWRMQYISGAASDSGSVVPKPVEVEQVGENDSEQTGCVFCNLIRLPQSQDRASLILLRGAHNFVIMNLYPYNSAHLMVVPYEHTADLSALDADTASEMMALAQRLVGVIGEEYHPQGYNIGMNLGEAAGAGVADHLHMHIVPRWVGDTNFMPVVGSTKVLPELLETTYDRLKARLR